MDLMCVINIWNKGAFGKKKNLEKKKNLTLRANKAPANVDVFVVLAAFARSEVVWTEETVVGQHQTACCHTVVIGMISHRAAHTSSQST